MQNHDRQLPATRFKNNIDRFEINSEKLNEEQTPQFIHRQ